MSHKNLFCDSEESSDEDKPLFGNNTNIKLNHSGHFIFVIIIKIIIFIYKNKLHILFIYLFLLKV